MSGQLVAIIQRHLDDYGVTESEFARRIGTSPQTVNSWKKRGLRQLPDKRLLVGISDVTRRPYDEVLTAALHDINYLPKGSSHVRPASTTKARRAGYPEEVPPIPLDAAADRGHNEGRRLRLQQDDEAESP